MKRFEKALAASVLSTGVTVGMFAVGSSLEHTRNVDRRACLSQLNGKDQTTCLDGLSQNPYNKSLLETGELLGIIGSLAAGVQVYRALINEE